MSAYYHDTLPPDPASKTGRVWEIADEITQEQGRRAKREEVIHTYVAEGGNANTASTQYSRWNKFYRDKTGSHAADHGPARARSTAAAQLTVGADGRFVIPAEMRAAMLIGSDNRVTARVVDGELRVIAPAVAIRRAQEMVRSTIPSGASLADELIAERRAEAHLEDAT